MDWTLVSVIIAMISLFGGVIVYYIVDRVKLENRLTKLEEHKKIQQSFIDNIMKNYFHANGQKEKSEDKK